MRFILVLFIGLTSSLTYAGEVEVTGSEADELYSSMTQVISSQNGMVDRTKKTDGINTCERTQNNNPRFIGYGEISYRCLVQKQSLEKAICLESGQTSPYIGVEYSTSKDIFDLRIISADSSGKVIVENIEGSDPELSIRKAVTDDGETLIIINSMKFDEQSLEATIRVLVCSPSN